MCGHPHYLSDVPLVVPEMIFFTIVLLALLEVSLSFDNAVINSIVLQKMNRAWQNRFILFGLPIAVIGMRLLLPLVMVSFLAHATLLTSLQLAIYDPVTYGQKIRNGQPIIDAFGGIFLLMTFLSFLCDADKVTHWIKPIEQHAIKLERFYEAATLVLLVALIASVPHDIEEQVAAGGLCAFFLFMALDMLDIKNPSTSGLWAFLSLEVLDASCSFDGVAASFVLTNNIFLIMIGLGIGAFLIRSLTIYLVRGGQLKEFKYLEHGAHYSIGALSVIMLTDIFYSVPEPVTGMCGISLILLSLLKKE